MMTMPKHRNTIKRDPQNGKYGDCHRACVATILGLEMEDVPHFYANPKIDGQPIIDEFLARFNLREANSFYSVDTGIDMIMSTTKFLMPGVPAILGGTSRTGCNHSVVILDGEIYNDPTDTGIVGPLDNGYYCVTVFAAKPCFANVRKPIAVASKRYISQIRKPKDAVGNYSAEIEELIKRLDSFNGDGYARFQGMTMTEKASITLRTLLAENESLREELKAAQRPY